MFLRQSYRNNPLPTTHLSSTLRQTEGFVTSILQLMKLKMKVPDHTTVYPRLRPPNKKMLLGYSILQTKPGDEDA